MTPAEKAVIEAAVTLSDEGQTDHWTACAVVVAVEALRAERAAAEDTRPWSLVVAEDEIYSTKTQKWYRVTKTVRRETWSEIYCEGAAKPFTVDPKGQVKVRRSEMGQAVDVWAGLEVISS